MARTPDSTRRSERSRAAILSATRELVGEVAYAKLTIEAIAARAGVGKQTIYRWWPSKGAVVFDAILAQSEDAEGAIELPDTGDLAADLKTVLRATVAEFADPAFDAPLRAVLTEVVNDPGLAAQYREQLEQPVHAAKVRRLAKARSAGQIRADADLDLMVDLLYGPITQRWLPRSGPLDTAFADALVDAVLRAFAPTD